MLFAAQVCDLFASGRSIRKGYTEIFAAQFATLSRVELPVAKNTQKFLFFKVFFLVFQQLVLATCTRLVSVAKIACFAQNGLVLNLFSFPSNISDYSSLSLPEHSQTHRITLKQTSILLNFILKSSRKRYGFSLSHYIFHVLSFVFLDL